MKLRTGDSWIPAPEYGHSLSGLSINLLVKNIDNALRFQTGVIGASVVYSDPDFAVLQMVGSEWMIHADHTYQGTALHRFVQSIDTRGLGIELRIHGRDPDEAVKLARKLEYVVVADPQDKPHGLREAYIADDDGYIWVPDIPI